jgi:hypothetical protein
VLHYVDADGQVSHLSLRNGGAAALRIMASRARKVPQFPENIATPLRVSVNQLVSDGHLDNPDAILSRFDTLQKVSMDDMKIALD